LRDYGHEGQIGLEQTPEEYIAAMVEVFRCVWDILADDGTLWVNIGDSYAGSGKGRNADGSHQDSGKQGTNKGTILGSLIKTNAPNCKPKDLIGIPWMLAFALRADGWYLRQDIIWHKPNPMPESVQDRCTKAHEYIFLLSKSDRYFFDNEAIKQPMSSNSTPSKGKRGANMSANAVLGSPTQLGNGSRGCENGLVNRRSVWQIATRPYKGAHFATYPTALIEPCILAGSRPDDIVLDPFMGSGTTAAVAIQHGRQYLGCELNPAYGELQEQRIKESQPKESPQIDMFNYA
jgi:DNA modification methylase